MSLRTGRRKNINTAEAHAGYVSGKSAEDYKKYVAQPDRGGQEERHRSPDGSGDGSHEGADPDQRELVTLHSHEKLVTFVS
ncbi:MAG: hypothetical protein M3021_04550 [Actinomycetota bacterium]|nr:hypothetical protein [Actinomycetota bacterium]